MFKKTVFPRRSTPQSSSSFHGTGNFLSPLFTPRLCRHRSPRRRGPQLPLNQPEPLPILPPGPKPVRSGPSDLPDLTGSELLFTDLLQKTTGYHVLPFDQSNEVHAAIFSAVSAAAADCQSHFSGPDSPISKFRRINEASRLFEDRLQLLLDANPTFSCGVPRNAAGHLQRSGYPDLRIEHLPTGTVVYLDPKLFEETSADSTFRTFYYEPRRETGKITEDARHLLLGFAHDGKNGEWTFTQWHLADLSRLQVTLKAEFSASNRELYQADLLIGP